MVQLKMVIIFGLLITTTAFADPTEWDLLRTGRGIDAAVASCKDPSLHNNIDLKADEVIRAFSLDGMDKAIRAKLTTPQEKERLLNYDTSLLGYQSGLMQAQAAVAYLSTESVKRSLTAEENSVLSQAKGDIASLEPRMRVVLSQKFKIFEAATKRMPDIRSGLRVYLKKTFPKEAEIEIREEPELHSGEDLVKGLLTGGMSSAGALPMGELATFRIVIKNPKVIFPKIDYPITFDLSTPLSETSLIRDPWNPSAPAKILANVKLSQRVLIRDGVESGSIPFYLEDYTGELARTACKEIELADAKNKALMGQRPSLQDSTGGRVGVYGSDKDFASTQADVLGTQPDAGKPAQSTEQR